MTTTSAVIPSTKNDRISYELVRTNTPVPRCHEREVFTVIRRIQANEYRSETVTPIIEILSTSDIKLLRKDDELNHVYYSDENHKIEILKKMKESLMDRFDETAPTSDCFEVNCCQEIDKLIHFIERNA